MECVCEPWAELASTCRNVGRVCTALYGVILKFAIIITRTRRTAVFYVTDIDIDNQS